jgi:predicted nucleic acid-binding protein
MSERRLVDTSVLSLILKRDSRAEQYLPHLEGQIGVISFITLAERYRWPEERNWGRNRREELARLLSIYSVAHSDDALCQTWALLISRLKPSGRVLPFADSWIAATALHLGLPLVTHNPRDFRGIPGVEVISAVQE